MAGQKYSVKRFREQGKTLRMLFLWRGSVYRLVWNEVLLWILVYYTLNLVYRFALNDEQKAAFEAIVSDVERGVSFVPLSFVLGFYANIVVARYWAMWDHLPRPDTLALRISTVIPGKEPRDRQIRRTAMRQILLAMVLTYRKISRPVKNKYPNLDSLVRKGLLNREEKQILETADRDTPPYWSPLIWAGSLFETARHENRIKDDLALGHLSSDLSYFRNFCSKTLQVDLIGIPLAYSQVVAIACYTFWFGSIICRQWVLNPEVSQENYFPIFTILQVIIFFGWLSVAESMIHPFGEDDDDFQLAWMIDKHINSAYRMVDSTDHKIPAVTEDPCWDQLRDESGQDNSPPPSPLFSKRSSASGPAASKVVVSENDDETPHPVGSHGGLHRKSRSGFGSSAGNQNQSPLARF